MQVGIEKIVTIKRNRKCDCCGKLYKKGAKMLFRKYKCARYDDDGENQIGIEYHTHYYCYDGKDRHYIDEDGVKISLLPCS